MGFISWSPPYTLQHNLYNDKMAKFQDTLQSPDNNYSWDEVVQYRLSQGRFKLNSLESKG